ncbi:MAG: DUF5063 domain-containing protein [Bacteroides sp.]|nr:DUF5063 domain-containing protein [Bacteroides sp.]
MSISPNAIAFIGLCKDYCNAIEQSGSMEQRDFVKEMLRLLPRLYISASDLPDEPEDFDTEEVGIEEAMDKEYYNQICSRLSALMGEDDTFLEVFEQDMKYSDTPIGASISETLADLMQVVYNFFTTVREAPTELIPGVLLTMKGDFNHYWSQKLCNVMRPLNQIYYK